MSLRSNDFVSLITGQTERQRVDREREREKPCAAEEETTSRDSIACIQHGRADRCSRPFDVTHNVIQPLMIVSVADLPPLSFSVATISFPCTTRTRPLAYGAVDAAPTLLA
jgi:hypothetical protein